MDDRGATRFGGVTAAPSWPAALMAADAIRAAAAVSVVVGLLHYGWLGGALFFLVLGGTMVPRALVAPVAFDLSYCATLLLGAWAAQLDWYLRVGWLDVAVHFAITGLVAATVHLTLVRVGMSAPVDDDNLTRPRLGSAALTAAMGSTLALLWEFGEWYGHSRLDERIQVGYSDTMGDLAASLVGAAVAGVLVARGVLLTGARR